MEASVKDGIERCMSIREAEDKYNISKSAIARSVVKVYMDNSNVKEFSYKPQFDVKRVFSLTEENDLVEYSKRAAYLHYGLTSNQTRILAYEYAKSNHNNVAQWKENKMTGISWLRMFPYRHPELSLQKPEVTSLAQATAFNKTTPYQIWNADESGCSSSHSPKILAAKGTKQIVSMTSGECGSNVTIIAAVSAAGNSVPPMFVFPRVHLKEYMLKGASPGSVGAANPSGWSNEEIFVQFINHFIMHSLGPKSCYHKALNDWMSSPGNAGKPVTIYHVCEIVVRSSEASFTRNITGGSRVAVIVTLDEDIFEDAGFLPSFVTDCPPHQENEGYTAIDGINSMQKDTSNQ
ncbi:hypothetical protein PR048_002738 [Dryococelus australis]|uniref:DDE-1 domain-containing protein n=1 Tax=Dryococelus australis TaxID=614101 RepID=A0ABQ9IL24_9NEOP|nr:hypothetical protein PR048_002738 [Dryococelus australis]